MWSSHKAIESTIIINHRSKVLFPGTVLLLWFVLMRALCLSSMVVVSSGCRVLQFDMRLWFRAVDQTLN